MNQKVVSLRRLSYEAKRFTASTVFGTFEASGTLCGHIDIVGPFAGTYALSPDEMLDVIVMLQQARADVLEHSDPLHDPRLMEGHRESPEGVKEETNDGR